MGIVMGRGRDWMGKAAGAARECTGLNVLGSKVVEAEAGGDNGNWSGTMDEPLKVYWTECAEQKDALG